MRRRKHSNRLVTRQDIARAKKSYKLRDKISQEDPETLSDQYPLVIGENTERERLFGENPEFTTPHISFSKVLCIFSDGLLAYCLGLATYSIIKYFRVLSDMAYLGDMGYSNQPDLSFLAYLLPAAFVFAGLTHTFYYNKERFANCIKIRFEYIKQLLMFKLNSGLYDKSDLTMQVDGVITQAEIEADALIAQDLNRTEQEQDNINL